MTAAINTSETANKATSPRGDVIALWGGILFSLVFTGVIWALGARLDNIELLPDSGPAWYYWKLPNPTFWTRATAWGFYLLHQVSLWGLIYYAQSQKSKYKSGLHRFNLVALAANAFFIILHLIQTHIWYDGLAQDTPIWSSQGSVIIMLVAILLIENKRRGLFFGKKAPIPDSSDKFWRRNHGYVFAWAMVYTFWFHPTIGSTGHLLGFFYMFLLMLQGSLFFTRIHLNKWWTFAQEGIVLVHGTLVAVMQGNGIWPMFAFGFAGLIVITQMYGLGLKRWAKLVILGIYIGGVLLVYSQRDLLALNEIIRIPIIEYISVFALAGLTSGGLWIAKQFKRRDSGKLVKTKPASG